MAANWILEEAHPFDLGGGIWWYCMDHHEGQSSRKYEIGSSIDFRPGASARGPEEGMEKEVYDALASGDLDLEVAYRAFQRGWAKHKREGNPRAARGGWLSKKTPEQVVEMIWDADWMAPKFFEKTHGAPAHPKMLYEEARTYQGRDMGRTPAQRLLSKYVNLRWLKPAAFVRMYGTEPDERELMKEFGSFVSAWSSPDTRERAASLFVPAAYRGDSYRAYVQGVVAARTGARNPYPPDSIIGRAWQAGLDSRRPNPTFPPSFGDRAVLEEARRFRSTMAALRAAGLKPVLEHTGGNCVALVVTGQDPGRVAIVTGELDPTLPEGPDGPFQVVTYSRDGWYQGTEDPPVDGTGPFRGADELIAGIKDALFRDAGGCGVCGGNHETDLCGAGDARPPVRNRERAVRLARAFSRELAREIGPKKMAQVRRRNRRKPYSDPGGPCASHDFCDANQVMLDAFREEFGRETVMPSEAEEKPELAWTAHDDQNLRLQAWDLARAAGYDERKIGR